MRHMGRRTTWAHGCARQQALRRSLKYPVIYVTSEYKSSVTLFAVGQILQMITMKGAKEQIMLKVMNTWSGKSRNRYLLILQIAVSQHSFRHKSQCG